MKIEKVDSGTFEKGGVELYRSKNSMSLSIWIENGLISTNVFPIVTMRLYQKYNSREVLDTKERTNYKWENE